MKITAHNTILAAGILAALPTLAAAHSGSHAGVTIAGLTYEETYKEKLKGGKEVASKATTLNGNMKFATCPAGTPCGISELDAETPWAIYANGTLLGAGTLGDDSKAKFSTKKGKATINLTNGNLKVTWDKRFIKFNLKWSGDALLAKGYIDTAQKNLSVPGGAQFDVLVGETRALFDTPAKGSAKVKKKGSVLLSEIILAGKAKSAGDPSAVDRDGDGYTNDVEASMDASCDYDATRNPGVTEKRLDGIDSNCDGDRADRGLLGRDSDVPEVLDSFTLGTAFSSPVVNFATDGTGVRDFTGWNKTFPFASVGKVSFYDPTTGNSYNDYTVTPEADGKGIWRAWTHTGKWGYFNGKAGETIKITLEKGSLATLPGTHPAFIIFWRPEGAPLPWEGTESVGADGKMGSADDIVPAHNVPQKADWTLRGLPEKSNHVMPEGIDTTLYPARSGEYTLYHVAAGWDKDLYVPTNKFVMHPSALNDISVSDGVPGKLVKTITLPKDGYYIMQVTNVLEAEDWAVCVDGDSREICKNASSSSTSPGAGHGSSKTGLGTKNELNPTSADKTSINDIEVTITPSVESSLLIDPGPLGEGGQGIHYHYVLSGMTAGQSTTIYGHDKKFPDVMKPGDFIWGVGQHSWCQNGVCTGSGNGTSSGWNHTGVHLGFELAEPAKVTIEMSNATPSTDSASVIQGPIPLGNDLKPGFSLYSGKSTTGPNNTSHTFENQTTIGWTNLTAILDWKDAGDANSVSGTYDLAAGFYTLYIGGNFKNVNNTDATLAGSTDRYVTRAPKDPANPGPCEGVHLAGCGGTEKDFKLTISAAKS